MANIDPLDRHPAVWDAAITTRHGRQRVAHYGSAAGELAACVRGIGIIDRSELAILTLHGTGPELAELLLALTGRAVAVGGALRRNGAWLCRSTSRDALVCCDADAAERIAAQVHDAIERFPACTTDDLSQRCAAIGVVGRAAPDVLAALGAYGDGGDARSAPPFACRRLAELDVRWLLESDHAALAFVDRADATAAWQAIVAIARPFGIARIGLDALDRYMLIERSGPGGARDRLV